MQKASFKKSERLCGVIAISELFAEGKSLNMPSLRVICRFTPAADRMYPGSSRSKTADYPQ